MKTVRTRPSSDGSVSDGGRAHSERFTSRWETFVISNFPFYSTLFTDFLPIALVSPGPPTPFPFLAAFPSSMCFIRITLSWDSSGLFLSRACWKTWEWPSVISNPDRPAGVSQGVSCLFLLSLFARPHRVV